MSMPSASITTFLRAIPTTSAPGAAWTAPARPAPLNGIRHPQTRPRTVQWRDVAKAAKRLNVVRKIAGVSKFVEKTPSLAE